MSSNVTFQTQLTTIMGILCDSALVEISKLVDEGSAMLRLEVSQSHGENEALKRKLKLMESELKTARGHQKGREAARGGPFACRSVGVQTGDEIRAADGAFLRPGVLEEPCPTIDSVFGKEWCLSLWRDGHSVEEDDSMLHCGTMVDEFTERPSSPLVKDEKDQKSDQGEWNTKTISAVWEQNLKTIPAVGEQNLKTIPAVGEQNLKTIPAVGEQNLKTIPAVGEQNLKTIPAVGEQNLKTIPAVGEQNLKTISAVGQEEQDIMQITPPESITESNSDAENLAGTSVNTEKHTDVHKNITGGKRLLCSLCGKSFEYLSYLKIHLRSHSGEKPFSCTVCGKSFAQKTYLTLHWRTHTGEKPYSCVECGKCFSQKSSLNSHLRSHTGEKPYSCTLCGKSYAYKHGLNLHHCVHSGRNDIISVSLDSD